LEYRTRPKQPSAEHVIYVATRLYNYVDKVHAEEIERAVINGVFKAFPTFKTPAGSVDFTFVPYRDTNEHLITSSDKAKILYRKDIRRLNAAYALVTHFDGLSKDEGISFEIGYAFATNVPIVVLVTDFVDFVAKLNDKNHFVVDPVIELMIDYLLRNYHLSTDTSFQEALHRGWIASLKQVEEAVFQICINNPNRKRQVLPLFAPNKLKRKIQVYLDFGGGMYEWQRKLQDVVATSLDQVTNIEVASAQRFIFGRNQERLPSRDLGYQDLMNAATSEVLILCADMDEAGAGVAALQGMAVARGQKVILYDSRTTFIRSDDGLLMSRNLMLDQSATSIAESIHDIPALLDSLVNL
jgi:nucleoside 2-deoxyribosyltransferase